jgi:tetratricopeptide (TPR) repeat protein
MPSQDPADWFEDLNVHVDDEELLEYAGELESALRSGVGSRAAAAAWTIVVSLLAGAFGGFTVSGEVRSSWLMFAAYLAAAAIFIRIVKPVGTRLVGDRGAWLAMFAAFWSVLLAMTAVMSARIDTIWLANVASIGGGLFIGLMYMSLNSSFMRNEDAWLLGALPLGGLSAWSASSVQRGFDAGSGPAWSEIFTGIMATSVFVVPVAVVGALLATRTAALAKLATLYLHNENFTAKAIEYLDEAIARSPRSADLYNLRGVAHSKAGDGARADADFEMVSALSPRAAEAHMNRGVDFLRQGDFDRAVDALKRAAHVNPKLATAFSNLGTAYQKKGELDAAIASYTRAIELRARYPVAFANRSYSHFLKGDHQLAIADAARAIALDGRLAMAHTNLGHALAAKGDLSAAAQSFRRSLALSPDRAVEEETLEALERLGVSNTDDEDDDEEGDEDE